MRWRLQALLVKRLGIRLVVIGMTRLANMTVQLKDIASSVIDFYRIDDLSNYNSLAVQLATDICRTLRQFIPACYATVLRYCLSVT